MKKYIFFIFLCLLSSNKLFASSSQLWFSDQPPDKKMIKDMQMRHGGYVHVVDGVDVKQLWLRKGDGLNQSSYLASATGEYKILDVQQGMSIPQSANEDKQESIRFPMPDEGFYNAYFIERLVNNDTLAVTTAKAEVLKHSCREGHKYNRKLVNPNHWNDAPLDIVRLRFPKEDFHTRIRSGTEVKFQLLHKGKPAPDVRVKLETKQGWIKSILSDEKGIATFQIIQDNFFDAEKAKEQSKIAELGKTPEYSNKDNKELHTGSNSKKPVKKAQTGYGGRVRIRDNFLVTAEYLTDEEGSLDNQAYSQTQYMVTMTGRYYPNQLANKSSSQGLLFTSAGIMVMGIGAYNYRRRRVKPFKEDSFDEH